jgi:putative ABC transport system permease protein
MRELFHEIGSTLRQNKLRTALTGLAVSWGIFLLITLLGAGNGLMNSLRGNMDQYVSQSISVEGWRTSKPYAGYKENRRIQLDQRDLDYTNGTQWEGTIGNVISATASSSVKLMLEGRYADGWLQGQMPFQQEQDKLQMAAGRFLNDQDIREQRKVMVVSMAHANILSPGNPKALIGRWINAGQIAFRVVGIYHTNEQDFRRSCPIPYSTYKKIYDRSDKVETITFTVDGLNSLEEHEAFQEEYVGTLRRMHDVAPDDKRGIWVMNGYTENLQMNKAAGMLSTALWILGMLTLISGIVGVSNIMLITVKERTREFGIRKAIGAKPGNILSLIITESVVITALFGYLGMLMGMLACQLLDKTVGQRGVNIGFETIHMMVNPSVDVSTALNATLLLIVAGTFAGMVPAWKAARVKPIEALRAE